MEKDRLPPAIMGVLLRLPNINGELTTMQFLVTSCLISDYAKPIPTPNVRRFMQTQKLLLTFPVCLDVYRGVEKISSSNPVKSAALASWFRNVIREHGFVESMTPEVAEVLAAILACKPIKNVWFNSPTEKHPGYEASVMIAALAIAHETPIATSNESDFRQIGAHFELPGVFYPAKAIWEDRSRSAFPRRPLGT